MFLACQSRALPSPEIDGDSLLSDEKSFDELHSIFEEGANWGIVSLTFGSRPGYGFSGSHSGALENGVG